MIAKCDEPRASPVFDDTTNMLLDPVLDQIRDLGVIEFQRHSVAIAMTIWLPNIGLFGSRPSCFETTVPRASPTSPGSTATKAEVCDEAPRGLPYTLRRL